jgi:hypothetical protein
MTGREMIDLALRRDTVITPPGIGAYDIRVAGEKIASVSVPGDLPFEMAPGSVSRHHPLVETTHGAV